MGNGTLIIEGNFPLEADERYRSASADPIADETAINEMLNTIYKHMEEVESLHTMSNKAVQLLNETNRANNALEEKMSKLRLWLLTLHDRRANTGKINASDVGPEDNRWNTNYPEIPRGSETNQELCQAHAVLENKTAQVEQLYVSKADQEVLLPAISAVWEACREYERLTQLYKAGLLRPNQTQHPVIE